MRIHWSPYLNNRTRTSILRPLLPGQHQLRANPQPNHTTCSRASNNPPPHSNMMIPCQLGKSCPPPSPQPHRRTNNHHIPLQLILLIPSPNRHRHTNHCWLLFIPFSDNPTRPHPPTHFSPRTISHPRTLAHYPPPYALNTTNPETRADLRLMFL